MAAPCASGRRKRQASGGVRLILNHFGEENLGCRGHVAGGHLLGIAHQFVEMDFRSGNKSTDAAAAFDNAFLFECGQGMAGSHEADLMELSEIAFGSDRIAGAKMAGVDSLAYCGLNSLIGGQRGVCLGSHIVHLDTCAGGSQGTSSRSLADANMRGERSVSWSDALYSLAQSNRKRECE